MDHIDVLRQEYMNHLLVAPESAGDVRVPDRDSFIVIPSGGGWVESTGQYPYEYTHILNESLSDLLSQFKSAIDNNINVTYTTDVGVELTWPSTAEVVVSSGFRNPERNERVKGAKASRHMLGRALDVAVSGVSDENKAIAYYIVWEILKNNWPQNADRIDIEISSANWSKRMYSGGTGEQNDTD